MFTRQLIALGKPGDIAFGFSTSGNSKNVLVAFEQAKKQGMLTIGLAGYDGGKMLHIAATDHCIVAPSDHIPRIQEGQATIYHALLEVLQAGLLNRTVAPQHLSDHHFQTGVVQ
jgi:D-sedoheptulose 7-phosphate isomerase